MPLLNELARQKAAQMQAESVQRIPTPILAAGLLQNNLSLPAQVNPMHQINPYYTQQQPQDAFAPMQMYQQYQQTHAMPQLPPSQFTPWTPQQSTPQTTSTALPGSGSVGGK